MATTLVPPAAFEDLTEVVAREYLRVSFDASGHVRSNEEQHDENATAIERRGWTLGASYEDVGSASKFQRKGRPGFDRLLRDLEGGTFGAQVLVLWESSRGSRKMGEWARMLDACEEHGVRIYVTLDRALYDPNVPRDWKALMDSAVDAEHESRKTSARVKRNSDANGEVGSFSGGRRPFGYEANGVDVNEAEAKVIRECAQWVLAGRSARWIAGELNRREVRTSAGNAWHPGPLRKVLTSKRIVGKRIHRGVEVGKATWPAIIDEVTHKRVVATFAARTPVGRGPRMPWLLTGLLRCGLCGQGLSSNTKTKSGARQYICRKGPGYRGCGRLSIRALEVEELLGKAAQARLVDVDARRDAAATMEDDGEELAELDRIAAQRVENAEDRRSGAISRETAITYAADLDARQKVVEASIAAKVSEVTPLAFVLAEGFVGRAWDDIEDVQERRRLLDALIDHVMVGPASVRGSKRFEPARMGVAWK